MSCSRPHPEQQKTATDSESCHLTLQMGGNDIENFLSIRLASSLIALIYVFQLEIRWDLGGLGAKIDPSDLNFEMKT